MQPGTRRHRHLPIGRPAGLARRHPPLRTQPLGPRRQGRQPIQLYTRRRTITPSHHPAPTPSNGRDDVSEWMKAPSTSAFLFTIRTYFYSIDELSADERGALLAAVETMSPASLEYKGLTGTIEILRRRLFTNT